MDPAALAADPKAKREIIKGKNLITLRRSLEFKRFGIQALFRARPKSQTDSTLTSTTLIVHPFPLLCARMSITCLLNKVKIEDYLRASGVPHAVLLILF